MQKHSYNTNTIQNETIRCNETQYYTIRCGTKEIKQYDTKSYNAILYDRKWYNMILFNECLRSISGTMEVQRLSIRLSCCVRNERSPPSVWTQTCGASTSSRTPDPPLTLQLTRLSCSLMTASWAWICLMEDSEWISNSASNTVTSVRKESDL